MTDFGKARTMMVECQVRTSDVTDHALLEALLAVPREKFVGPQLADLAYLDRDLAIDSGRFLMAPASFARLVQLAEIKPTDRVLVVGAGTGYGAAVIAQLALEVVALECDPGLAKLASAHLTGLPFVIVAEGPLEAGYKAEAPYDVILVQGAIEYLPDALAGQLAEGARLVAVVGLGLSGQATVVIRENGGLSWRSAFNAAVQPLPGFQIKYEFVL